MDNPMPESLWVPHKWSWGVLAKRWYLLVYREQQKIQIIVQGPDEKSDACGGASVHSVSNQGSSSFVWSMPTPLSTLSQSCTSLSASHRASSSEGTTLASSSYNSSSTPNPFAYPAVNITPSDIKRNDRGRIMYASTISIYNWPFTSLVQT
jgi:hypothetical protein